MGGRKMKPPQKREIEVRILTAENLPNVKTLSKMRCYAVVYIDPEHKEKTRIDERGGQNPVWNQKLVLVADDEILSNVLAAINVEIYASGHLRDKLVGNGRVLVSQVLKGGDPSNPVDNPISSTVIQLWNSRGDPEGVVTLWIPPTGRFLLYRSSTLSKSTKSDGDVEEAVAET